MSSNPISKKEDLMEAIAPIKAGITANRKNLTENVTLQFRDYREWIREYVVNAYDAGAAWVRILVIENDDETITVIVEDNGRGMNKMRVVDFMTVFRSRKDGGPDRPVGQHGIGKVSVGAIPGQCGFKMQTSTGTEAWRLETGSLLEDVPMTLEEMDLNPMPPAGTRFEITFEKKCSVEQELSALRNILDRYVRFLPIDITIGTPPETDGMRALPITRNWKSQFGIMGRSFRFNLPGHTFEVAMGAEGGKKHEVYQNRVLVSSDYNLLSRDLKSSINVPNIVIRVDSPDFELPFGRHALRNDWVLNPLSRHLREEILPSYIKDVHAEISEFGLDADILALRRLEEAALALLEHRHEAYPGLSSMPLFEDVYGEFHSLDALRKAERRHGVIYLENADAAGVDYTIFQAPVLSSRQSRAAVDVIKSVFKTSLLNLGVNNVVMEALPGSGIELGPKEKRFERQLQFRSSDMSAMENTRARREAAGRRVGGVPNIPDLLTGLAVCEEARAAVSSIEDIRFRVNYLVGPDGKTPSPTRRYLVKGEEVVLNLHHPKIKSLLELSEKAPALAGHFGLAMILSESRESLFNHLSAEAREDLILSDAVAKCGITELTEPREEHSTEEIDRAYFLRRMRSTVFN